MACLIGKLFVAAPGGGVTGDVKDGAMNGGAMKGLLVSKNCTMVLKAFRRKFRE